MKQFLSLLLILLLLGTALGTAGCKAAVPAASLPGDLDGDGTVSLQDAAALLKYSVGLGRPSTAALQAADTTGRDGPDARDALCILRHCGDAAFCFPIQTNNG